MLPKAVRLPLNCPQHMSVPSVRLCHSVWVQIVAVVRIILGCCGSTERMVAVTDFSDIDFVGLCIRNSRVSIHSICVFFRSTIGLLQRENYVLPNMQGTGRYTTLMKVPVKPFPKAKHWYLQHNMLEHTLFSLPAPAIRVKENDSEE